MLRSSALLKLVRQFHLYLGVFIAPSVLFFAITGAMQSVNLHEVLPGRAYKPAAWIVTLAQIHKKQTTEIAVRKPRPESSEKSAKAEKPAVTATAADSAAPKPKRHLPLKIFFALASLALAFSTLSGIFMAYRYNRSKLVIAALLAAGIFIPLLLLRF